MGEDRGARSASGRRVCSPPPRRSAWRGRPTRGASRGTVGAHRYGPLSPDRSTGRGGAADPRAERAAAGDRSAPAGALRWRGGAFFDGTWHGGRHRLPVPLSRGWPTCAGIRHHVSREQFAPSERVVVDGLPVARSARSRRDAAYGLAPACVQAVEMAAAARLISVGLMASYVSHRPAWTGVPLVRKALEIAIDTSRSPRETWMRLVWLRAVRPSATSPCTTGTDGCGVSRSVRPGGRAGGGVRRRRPQGPRPAPPRRGA